MRNCQSIVCLLSLIVLVVGLVACSKKVEKVKDGGQLEFTPIEDSTANYCSKGLAYDGYNGVIDSLIIDEYLIEDEKEILLNRTRKYFDSKGYLVGEEIKTYVQNDLESVTYTAYTRDEDSFVSLQQINNITHMGSGYTKQYALVERVNNTETWEYLRKMSGENIKLNAEDRVYTKDEMKIYDQVGNTLEMVLSTVYKFTPQGKIISEDKYKDDSVVYSVRYQYNPEMFVSEKIVTENAHDTKEIWNYVYDERENPIQVTITEDSKPKRILKYQIFYNEINFN